MIYFIPFNTKVEKGGEVSERKSTTKGKGRNHLGDSLMSD